MKLDKISTVFASICMVGLSVYFLNSGNLTDLTSNNFSIAVHRVNSGYGYTISEGAHLLIKQDFIPAIQNEIPFPNYDIARSSARLVVKKITRGQQPALTLEELQEIGLDLNRNETGITSGLPIQSLCP
ncbi:hypothetical protein APR41_05305 [Salegentibacter salinarum]|uniref:DUF4907 domain-containing protein n=1 Tax=Salegentibacter salinarum TaxID=447422 RepID=A0A2N0TSB6_9FLAO|nr:DUF4907 domain-containing protein [Salegentibacter salinarum]PKD17629.1 hypothetical protein APR41_05305 [Salegentibacter salinarum]